jgi:hypothetical protein
MPKERTINPATAALKASKARTIKKSRAAVAAQRSERNSHRDPGRLERRIADLQARREASKGGRLPAADEKALAELERDLGRVRKARENAGYGGDKGGRGEDRGRGGRDGRESRGGGAVLGKRRRDGTNPNMQPLGDGARFSDDEGGSGASDTDPEARDIPMPTDHDHEPPVPSRRRAPRFAPPPRAAPGGPHALPAKPGAAAAAAATQRMPVHEQKTVYAAAPQLRDLQKEAVKRFVPAAVASKLAAVRGEGGRLVEPEEADRLEKEGYRAAPAPAKPAAVAREGGRRPGDAGPGAAVEGSGDDEDDAVEALAKLEEEERRFREEAQKSSRHVQVEEVDDEDL